MFIKKKHVVVILFSSLIVSTVLILTLFGYLIYLHWTKESISIKYRTSILKLTADLFSREINVSGIRVVKSNVYGAEDVLVLEGTIENKSNKTITTLSLSISFMDASGAVLYKTIFEPVGNMSVNSMDLYSVGVYTKSVLLPGQSVSFRHKLLGIPKNIKGQLIEDSNFARGVNSQTIKIIDKIVELGVL